MSFSVGIFICFGLSLFLRVISAFNINLQRPYFQLGSNAGVLTEHQCENGKYHLNLGGCFCVPESVYACQGIGSWVAVCMFVSVNAHRCVWIHF